MKFSSINVPVLTIAGLLFIHSCSSSKYNSGEIEMKKIENSDHYKDGIFLNYKDNYEINFFKTLPIRQAPFRGDAAGGSEGSGRVGL